MQPRRHAPAGSLLVALGTALVVSCAVGPDFRAPSPPAVASYADAAQRGGDSGVSYVHYVDVDQVPIRWWGSFNAAGLDVVVTEAMRNGPSLAAAQAMLRQSLDARRAGYGVFMPQISGDASATRERSAPLRLGSEIPGSVFNVFTLSGSVGYVLDAFGGARRRVEVLGAQADEARENARATYLSLTANVVSTSIARSAYAEEAAITRLLIEDARTQYELTKDRYQAGAGAYADVASLRAELAALEATLPAYAQHEEQALHLLSTLCGHAPTDWQPPAVPFSEYSVPASLPVLVPARLVRQRPDIRAAEARLHQSSANVGVATADLFPSITLSAQMGSASSALSQIGSSEGRFWSGGGDLSVPLFQGGTLWYTRRAAVEAYQASLQDYRSAVLLGLDQVADALRALDHDAETIAATAKALRAAELTKRLAQANYAAGIADYLTLLSADRALANARLADVQALAQRLQDVVALFVAIGGDWASQPPATVEGVH